MSKIIDTIWMSCPSGTIGIVLTDNGTEKKAYIKNIDGFNEQSDINNIKEWGAKIMLSQAQKIVAHLTE